MQLDSETWLYALGGAALLIAGGAVLRGQSAPGARSEGQASKVPAKPSASDSALAEAAKQVAAVEMDLASAEKRAKAAEAELKTLRAAKPAEGPNPDLEKALADAKAAAKATEGDLTAERALVQQMEKALEEVRKKLEDAHTEARDAAARAVTAEELLIEERTKSASVKSVVPKAPAVDPVPGLKRSLEAAQAERDAARREREEDAKRSKVAVETTAAELATAKEKIESLERLVEGVRARSKDLAAQLKALKPG